MSWRLKKNLPELLGLLERGRDGHFLVYVWCPYCAQWEQHGWTKGTKRRGSHASGLAHCMNQNSPLRDKEYFIRIPSRTELAKLAKRASETDALACECEVAR